MTMHSHTVHVKHKKCWNRVTGNVWTIQHESNIWDVTQFHHNEVEMAVNEWFQKPNLCFCQNRILNSCEDGKNVLLCSGITVVSSNDTIDWTYPGYRPNLGRGDSLRSLKESGSDDNNVEQRPRQY